MRYEPSPASPCSARQPGWQPHPPGDRQLPGAGIVLISDREDEAFQQSLARRGVNLTTVDRVIGLDYSPGKGRVILILYDLEPR
jgi:hypothetical protein